jgi:tRNA modification GTPase
MDCSQEETIAAIVTPVASGGLGVIRISGHRAKEILSVLFKPSNDARIESHRMLHGCLFSTAENQKIDDILACFMQSPKSYTGEDVAELFCHGSIAILGKALELALNYGARLAQRGEFTKRAFLNGKMDLAQAESVLDLVGSQTFEGAGYAVQQLDGRLSNQVKRIRKELLGLLAELEGRIDFPEDFSELDYSGLNSCIAASLQKIGELLSKGISSRIYREGVSVVIVGRPNVGKSSLLNALLEENRVIVTSTPGTTRDSIEESLEIRGLPLKLIDTAGLGAPVDSIERLGMDRTSNEMDMANLLLVVLDGSDKLKRYDLEIMDKVKNKQVVFVINKIDIAQGSNITSFEEFLCGQSVFKVSAKTHKGIENLKEGIYTSLRKRFFRQADALLLNARHRECFISAQGSLVRAIKGCVDMIAIELISIDLKEAVLALGEITGELVSEEVINKIFEQFCVGK